MLRQGAATNWNRERRAGQGPAMTRLPDDDLSHLSPEDRQRVRAWAEDRLINAITPLRWQLQRLSALEQAASPALIAARHAVMHVMAAIDEARAAAGTERALEPYALRERVSDVLEREIVAAKRAENVSDAPPAGEGSSGNPVCLLPADRCKLGV